MAKTKENMKQENTKAKAKVEQDEAPSYLDDESGQGYDGTSSSAPRIKILTMTSPPVVEGADEYIEGAKPGMFLHSVTKKVYKTLDVIPLRMVEVWTLWAPKEQGGGFRGKVLPHSIPITGDVFIEAYSQEGFKVQGALDVYVLLPSDLGSGPALLTLTGRGIKHGKVWRDRSMGVKLASGKAQPLYGSVWKLTTKLNSNKEGKWFTIGDDSGTSVERVRWITKDEHVVVKDCVDLINQGLNATLFAKNLPPAHGRAQIEAPAEGEDAPY